jgi:hypothetical protein
MQQDTNVVGTKSTSDKYSLRTEEIVISPHKFSFPSQKTTCESDYGEYAFDGYLSIEDSARNAGQHQDAEDHQSSLYSLMGFSIPVSSTEQHGREGGEEEEKEEEEEEEEEEEWIDGVETKELDKVPSSLEAALVGAESTPSTPPHQKNTSQQQKYNAHKPSRTKSIVPRGSGFERAERYIGPEQRRTASEPSPLKGIYW